MKVSVQMVLLYRIDCGGKAVSLEIELFDSKDQGTDLRANHLEYVSGEGITLYPRTVTYLGFSRKLPEAGSDKDVRRAIRVKDCKLLY